MSKMKTEFVVLVFAFVFAGHVLCGDMDQALSEGAGRKEPSLDVDSGKLAPELQPSSQKTEGGESEAKTVEANEAEAKAEVGEQQGDESVQVETEDDEAKESAAEEEEQPKKPKFEQDTAPTLTDVDIEAMGVTVEKNVFKLNISNFYQVVNNTRYMLINFYAPWCEHCVKMEPEYARAALTLRRRDPQVILAKVDTTVEQKLSNRFGVNKYPTLFFSHRGNTSEYENTFSAEGIVDAMAEKTDPMFEPPPEATLELTAVNFTLTINNAKLILIYFYAPWCGHCRRMSPEFERAARRLKEYNIPLGKVDATKEKSLAEVNEVRSYPTLLLYRRGRRFEYNGPREETGIVNHMLNLSQYPSKEVSSLKQFKKAIHPITITVLAVFSKSRGPFYKEFEAAANNLRGRHTFYHTYSMELAKHYKVTENSLVLFHPEILQSQYEEPYYTFSRPDATQVHMERFMEEHLFPLVGFRDVANLWKYINKYPLVVVFYDVDFGFDNKEETQRIRHKVLKVAQQYKGRVLFAVSHETDFEDDLKSLGLEDSGAEVNVGMWMSERERYRMAPVDDFKSANLRNFVESVLQGTLKQYVRSQTAPREQTRDVLTVVGSTFEELVMASDKDTLIMFRGPDCHMCDELVEELELCYNRIDYQAPDRFQSAIIDATQNDFPGIFKVDDFPTIYFVSAKDKMHPKLFQGIRKAFGLIKFVKENFSYDIPDRSDFSVFPAFKRPKPPKDDKAKDDKAKDEKSDTSAKPKEEL
ncbi:protein disulfide-isomerase A4-like [Dermacentor silvarum]|uniref:protein disulfide-isomerase A4-like n=1 Tax=Dermacentor silvarum TaxID=543639 RepID=UPI00189ABF37|nr:protein disulfide-isomerase A4-like [Dermacentor silvarum]